MRDSVRAIRFLVSIETDRHTRLFEGINYVDRLLVDDSKQDAFIRFNDSESEVSSLQVTRSATLSAIAQKYYALSAAASLFK